MGKDYKGVFAGCEWFIPDAEESTEFVPELLAENNIRFLLPEHYVCFFSHQGYMAAWFLLPKQNDDPQVWFYSEGAEMNAPEIKDTFTDFLFKDMEGLASVLPNLRKTVND